MWTIWKEELYKIASRKLVWLGVSLLLAFVTFRLYSEQNTYSSTIDGKTYRGAEAIKKDQELTRLYAGTLTLDKVKQIYEEYGFFFYDKDDKTRLGNYCNWFISKEFTNFMQTDGYDPGQVHFYTGQDWEYNAEPLLHGGIRFDYIYGWSDLAEIYLMTIIVLFILLIIGLTPLFSEEYQLKTADILRTTRRGRQSGIWMKILAALFFSVVLTLAVTAYLWGIYLDVYGTQGLDASAALLSFAYGYYPETAAGFLVFLFFLGLAGAILLTGLTAGVSAFCQSPFLALVISVAGFLLPVFWIKVFAPTWILGPRLTKLVTHFMASMPAYLPQNPGFSFSRGQLILHLCIALAAGTGGILLGYRRYRSASH